MAIPVGGQNFLKTLFRSDTPAGKAFKYGIDQPTENTATTLEALGYDDAAAGLQSLVTAPENYESAAARFMNPEGEGYNWKDLPLATVEQSGQLAGSMALRAAGAGVGTLAGSPVLGAILAFGGPALFEAVQIAGPVALDRARNRDPQGVEKEPNGQDWAGAMGTAAFSGVLNAIGVKGIPGLNVALGTTGKTIAQTAGAGLREGVTEGLQSVTEQVGSTAFTDKGLTIDPKQALGEGILGTSAGVATTAPAAVIQAVNSMGQTPPTTPDAAVEAMGPFLPTTPDAAVEAMGTTQQFQEGLQQYEQEVPPPDPLDEQNVQADQSDRDAFIETQENYINSFIDNQNIEGTLNSAARANILMDVQDHIRSNFELYDSREPQNTPEQIRQNIDSIVRTEIENRARADSMNVDVAGERDIRFDTPGRTIQDIYGQNVYTQNVYKSSREGGKSYRLPPESPRAGITSIETGIDPMFMTQSVILGNNQAILNNLPKTMTAADAMQKLGIKEVGNWFEPSNQKMVPIANEAINTEVASFLKARKEQKTNVTREEIRDIMHDSISRHETITTEGSDTSREGGYNFSNLSDIFPGLEYRRDSVEKWSQYDARLPEGQNAEDSMYYHQVDDDTHSPHGAGANMWWRGFNVKDPMGEGEGILLAENQSNLHGHSQSKKYDDLYLSDYKAAQEGRGSEKIQKIKDRETRFDFTETLFVDTVEKDTSIIDKGTFGQNVSDLAKGKTPERIGATLEMELGSISPEYQEASRRITDKRHEKAVLRAFKEIVDAQPFGGLGQTFTEEQLLETRDTHPEKDLGVTVDQVVLKILENRGVDAYELAITEGEYARAIQETRDIRFENIVAEDKASLPEKTALAKKYLPALAKKYPSINDLLIQGKAFPTEAELKEVQDFEYSQRIGATEVRPDYPFKNNNAAMNVRSAIVEAIDSGKSFLFLGSSGYGGAPTSTYKNQLKEAERIAKQIGQLTGTDYKEIFKMAESTYAYGAEGPISKYKIDKEWESQGGPYYRLDLRQLKQLIDAKLFPGFVGYKKGGLVTKAQGAGYSMNLGNYGRNYT